MAVSRLYIYSYGASIPEGLEAVLSGFALREPRQVRVGGCSCYVYIVPEALGVVEVRHQLYAQLLPWVRQDALAVGYVARQGRIARLVTDLDGTLTAREGLLHLAELYRPSLIAELEEATREAMLGAVDFRASFVRRSQCFVGLSREDLSGAMASLPLAKGAERVAELCRGEGLSFGVATSAYDVLAEALRERLGFDTLLASSTLRQGERLMGLNPLGIVDAEAKARFALGHSLGRATLVVGDGANDLAMLSGADFALLYCALPKWGAGAALALDDLLRVYLDSCEV